MRKTERQIKRILQNSLSGFETSFEEIKCKIAYDNSPVEHRRLSCSRHPVIKLACLMTSGLLLVIVSVSNRPIGQASNSSNASNSPTSSISPDSSSTASEIKPMEIINE